MFTPSHTKSRISSAVGLPLLRGRKLRWLEGPLQGCGAVLRDLCSNEGGNRHTFRALLPCGLWLVRLRGPWGSGTLRKCGACEKLKGGDCRKAEDAADYDESSAACQKRCRNKCCYFTPSCMPASRVVLSWPAQSNRTHRYTAHRPQFFFGLGSCGWGCSC